MWKNGYHPKIYIGENTVETMYMATTMELEYIGNGWYNLITTVPNIGFRHEQKIYRNSAARWLKTWKNLASTEPQNYRLIKAL